jgi:Flp pilus assembly protein TadD
MLSTLHGLSHLPRLGRHPPGLRSSGVTIPDPWTRAGDAASPRMMTTIPSGKGVTGQKDAVPDGRSHLVWGVRDHARAVEFLKEAIHIEPRAVDAHLDLARCLKVLGRLAEAREHLAEAQRLDPGVTL